MLPNLGSRGISNVVFSVIVVILLLVAAVGFGLYASKPAVMETMTVTMTETAMSSSMAETGLSGTENFSYVHAFTPEAGAMLSNAWLVVAPAQMGEYVVAVHAEGLGPNGEYIVEGPLSTGSMQVVPVSTQSMSMNTTAASEFTADSHGNGLFWIVLNSNPISTFEAVQLYYLPGTMMQNATLVASVMFTMMSS